MTNDEWAGGGCKEQGTLMFAQGGRRQMGASVCAPTVGIHSEGPSASVRHFPTEDDPSIPNCRVLRAIHGPDAARSGPSEWEASPRSGEIPVPAERRRGHGSACDGLTIEDC